MEGNVEHTEESAIFRFRQPVPTSAYLIALAAGRLEAKDISPRVRIWSEPEVVEKAAFEFSETENFLKVAEELTIPYVWGRYDVLCLPPSFPYGGMENPCITFATPTLLAGDRSLADVIAHEIAHSWTGNLVTNVTWEHFWLNEGWTVWLERKIMSRYKGNSELLKLSAQIGWKHLEDDINHFGADNGFTNLVWPLSGEDPDDAFSGVPYEKGFNLLMYLEGLVGTAEFEAFAKSYIDTFKFQTVSSEDFSNFFMKTFSTGPSADKVKAIDWDEVFYKPGLPRHIPDFSNSLSSEAETSAAAWLSVENGEFPVETHDVKSISHWTSQQTWYRFDFDII
jgi:leukotriene-A4 hydrolase